MISLNYREEGYSFPDIPLQTIIIDPPYNIGYNYKGQYKDTLHEDDYHNLIHNVLEDCWNHATESSSLFFINYPEVTFKYFKAIQDSSWNIHQFISWVYPNNSGHSKKRFTKASRSILWLTKDNPKIYINRVLQPFRNPDDKRVQTRIQAGITGTHLYDWWDVNLVKGNSKEKLGYVNQIPYEILKRCILTTSDKNEVVYDPMCGSGSTIYAASHLQRIGIGYDLSIEAKKIWTEIQAKGVNPYTALGYERDTT